MLPRRPFPPMPPRNISTQPVFQNQQMMNRPTGGLLSRLFGGRNQAVSAASNTTQTNSILTNIQQATNPASISSMMTNVQKALKVAESVGPMVQQYGPMVKNVPAMLKIYKALTSDTDTADETTAQTEEDQKTSLKSEDIRDPETDFLEPTPSGASKPKLYI